MEVTKITTPTFGELLFNWHFPQANVQYFLWKDLDPDTRQGADFALPRIAKEKRHSNEIRTDWR